MYERVFGPEHFEFAATLHNLAGVESPLGEEKATAAHYRRALALKGKILGEAPPGVGPHREQPGGYAGCRELLSWAAAVLEKPLEEERPLRELAKANLAGM